MAKENKEKRDFLKEAEVRTMQSDVLKAKGIVEVGKEKITGKGMDEGLEKERLALDSERQKIEEEKRRAERAEEEKKKTEQILEEKEDARERIGREETARKAEEATRSLDEKRRAEESERARKESERTRMEEERRKEEVRKKMDEERKRLEEERRREEALRSAKEEERRKENEKVRLVQEKAELASELQKIREKKQPLETEKNQLLERDNQLQKSLEEIIRRETEIEEERKNIREKEKSAKTAEEKRELEQKRWAIEEKRRKKEEERWEWEEEADKIKEKLREVNLRYQKSFSSEEDLKEKQRRIADREGEIRLEQEKAELASELQKIREKKQPLEAEKNRLLGKDGQLQKSLEEIIRRETEIERQEDDIENKEKSAKTAEEKREVEQRRWAIEENVKKIEEERWKSEEEINRVKNELKKVDSDYQGKVEKEKEMTKRQEEINHLLKGEKIEKMEKKVEPKGPQEVKKTDMTAEKKETEKFEPSIKNPLEPREEKKGEAGAEERIKELERLRREATMGLRRPEETKEKEGTEETAAGKELEDFRASLRERLEQSRPRFPAGQGLQKKENGKIRERLSEIQEEEELERKKFLERIQEEKRRRESVMGQKQKPEKTSVPLLPVEVFRPLPEKPSGFSKFFTRFLAFLLVLAFVAGVSLFVYWFFFVRKPPAPPVVWCEIEKKNLPEAEWTQEKCVPPPIVIPEIEIPQSLIPTDAIEDIQISKKISETRITDINSETFIYLSQVLKKDMASSTFVRVIIKDLAAKDVPGLKEFLDFAQVKTPDGLYDKLDPTFTLFIYSQKEGKRMGFIAKLAKTDDASKQDMTSLLRVWEETMENDFKDLFAFLGKNKPAINNFFSATINYRSSKIRCQTYSTEDFGSCYSVTGDYFIFTSSLESMRKAIDKLQ